MSIREDHVTSTLHVMMLIGKSKITVRGPGSNHD